MYGQYNNPQQMLPFPPNQLVGQFLNVGPQNPPFVPAGLPYPPQVQAFLPQLCAFLVMEIQNKARDNALRTFMFNQMSQNNYANQEFQALVVGACDFIMLHMAKRMYPDFGSGMNDAIPKVVEMVCAANARQYPALLQFIPQQLAPGIQHLIAQFATVCNEINMFTNSMQGGGMMGGVQQPMMQPQHQQFYTGYVGQQPMQQQQMGGGLQMVSGSGNTGLFNAGNANMNHLPGTRMGNTGSRYGGNDVFSEELAFEPDPVKQPFTARATTAQKPTPPVVPDITEDNVWEAVEETPVDSIEFEMVGHPYPIAFNPETHVVIYRNGVNSAQGIYIKKKEDGMNYSQHNLQPAFVDSGMIGHTDGADKTNMTELWSQVDKLSDTKDIVDESVADPDATPKAEVMTLNELVFQTSLDAAIISARVSHMAAQIAKKDSIYAYETYAEVVHPIAEERDYNAFIGQLHNSKTFADVVNRMGKLRNEIPDVIWFELDHRLTKAVNNALRLNLSLSNLSIDSFTQDVIDLLKLMERSPKYEGPIYQALVFRQEDIIRNAIGVVDVSDKEYVEKLVDLSDIESDLRPKLNILALTCSFTVLNCRVDELKLAINKDVGNLILGSVVPELYNLAKGIFERAKLMDADVRRHFVLTNDQRVLEITEGYLAEGSYLISVHN